jgi:uncharacterized membrane protein
MYNSIVMIFDDLKEATQIQSALRHLRATSTLDSDAAVVCKGEGGKLYAYPMSEECTNCAPSIRVLEEISPDKEFVQNVFDSIPQGDTAFFMLASEEDTSVALLTVLLLAAPSAIPTRLLQSAGRIEYVDDHFKAQVEYYHAAVANLEFLDAYSTEGDVEDIFQSVDDAYDRLVNFIATGQAA